MRILRTVLSLAAICTLGYHAVSLEAQAPARGPDDLLLVAMRRATPELPRRLVWRRQPVNVDTDVVLALAWPGNWGGCDKPCASAPVGPGMTLGLFLQDRRVPDRVTALTLASDLDECFARVLRVASTDVVLSCTGEKSEIFPHITLVYDIRTKALRGRYRFRPYTFADARLDASSTPPRVRVVARGERETEFDMVVGERPEFTRAVGGLPNASTTPTPADAAFGALDTPFGPSGAFRLVQDPWATGDFDRRVVESVTGRRTRHFCLPQTPYRAFTVARPGKVNDWPGERYNIDERIGPTQVAGGRLWFGKAFYDGEGQSGVGGLGYFDPADRGFHIFTGPAIADWSVLSLLVEPEVVWATLGAEGEWGGVGGGVVRFDRRTRAFRRISGTASGAFLRVSADEMLVVGSTLTVIRGDRAQSYFVDEMPQGQPRVVPLQ